MDHDAPIVRTADVSTLPRLARVAFAVRCARRVLFLHELLWKGSQIVGQAIGVIDQAESLAATNDASTVDPQEILNGTMAGMLSLSPRLKPFWEPQSPLILPTKVQMQVNLRRNQTSDPFQGQVRALRALIASVGDAALFAIGNDHPTMVPIRGETCDEKLSDAVSLAAECAEVILPAIRPLLPTDISYLHTAAIDEKWSDATPVPQQFFSLRSEFITRSEMADSNLIAETVTLVDAELVAYFRKHPQRLHSLTPRQFEQLIAEVFTEFEFDTELTKRTRDDGRDIVAIAHRKVSVKYLIECKHYNPDHKVGVTLVRALHGVVTDERATKGILVTTSRFTKPAQEFIERNEWRLEGRDFDGLLEWLDDYQHSVFRRIAAENMKETEG